MLDSFSYARVNCIPQYVGIRVSGMRFYLGLRGMQGIQDPCSMETVTLMKGIVAV